MSADSLDAMMHDYAAAAVDMAKDLGVTLDFSEQSLQGVEQILAQLAAELANERIAQVATSKLGDAPATPTGPSSDQMDQMCRLWGGYFGEVVRRRWGGEWSVEPYPGAQFATLTLTLSAGKMYPSIKVYRRLTEGEQDNLWRFYETIRERLASQPGAAVQ